MPRPPSKHTLRAARRWAGRQRSALPAPLPADPGPGWDACRYVMRSRDEQPLGSGLCDFHLCAAVSGRAGQQGPDAPFPRRLPPAAVASPGSGPAAPSGAEPFQGSRQGLYLPVQYSSAQLAAADELLVCGWMGQTFMWELMAELDHSHQVAGRGGGGGQLGRGGPNSPAQPC
jgi:hypothetical protein